MLGHTKRHSHTSTAFATWACGLMSIWHGIDTWGRWWHMHGADCGDFSTMSGLSGAYKPPPAPSFCGWWEVPFFQHFLWGAMLGVGCVFERGHCTVGWSIGCCKPVGLWVGADNVTRGVQGIDGPFLSLPVHYAEPHIVLVALASLGTTDRLPSPRARALCHTPRVGESMVHTSRPGTYTHHPNTMEEKTCLWGRGQRA